MICDTPMQLHKPDPKFIASKKAHRNFLLALQIALSVAGVLWFILITDQYLVLNLGRFGLRPRVADGLWGILTAPLLHGGVEHMARNTSDRDRITLLVDVLRSAYPDATERPSGRALQTHP